VRGEIKRNILIDAPIIKFRNLSTNFSPIQKNGKEAKTHIVPIKYDSDKNTTFIKAVPLTGRTHQIRIHLWHIGHPILGDPIYGQNETFRTKYIEKKITNTQRVLQTGANRLLLHAYSLEFEFKNKFFFVSKQNFNIV
jgi:23S rRNA pseudouridine1911/1915/1917 synthase